MSLKNFSVVKFLHDNTVEFVPSKWIIFKDSKTWVQFPKHLTSEYNFLRRDPSSLPRQAWPLWEVTIKNSYKNLEKAEKKAEKYQDTSDIDSSAVEGSIQTRSQADIRATVSNLMLNVPSGDLFEFNGLNASTPPPAFPVIPAFDPAVLQPPPSQVNCDNNLTSGIPPGVSEFVFTAIGEDPTLKAILEEQQAFQKKSLENQEIIIQNQEEIKTLLVRELSTRSAIDVVGQSLFAAIPIKSNEDFKALEQLVHDPQNREKLISALYRFGRTEITKTTADILNYLFDVGFSREVRLTENSGKLLFKNTRLCDCVRVAIERNHPTSKINSINTKIGNWLRGSSDRGGGRKLRQNENSKKNNKEKSNSDGGSGSQENQIAEANAAPSNESAESGGSI